MKSRVRLACPRLQPLVPTSSCPRRLILKAILSPAQPPNVLAASVLPFRVTPTSRPTAVVQLPIRGFATARIPVAATLISRPSLLLVGSRRRVSTRPQPPLLPVSRIRISLFSTSLQIAQPHTCPPPARARRAFGMSSLSQPQSPTVRDSPLREHRNRPVERLTDSLETPSLDDRSYRVIRLPNQLEVLLVHDADTDKASAAMDVNVGNFSDEEDMPGMAHAVE
jgi:hypothetical protein